MKRAREKNAIFGIQDYRITKFTRNSISILIAHMGGSRKFCQRGSKFDKLNIFFFYLVDEGIEDPNIAINGPSSANQRNL